MAADEANRWMGLIVQMMPPALLRAFLAALESRHLAAERAGYHVYPRTYFSPLLLQEEIERSALQSRRPLPGVMLNESQALALLAALAAYAAELDSIPYERIRSQPFWFANDWFNDFDAAVLHCLLRHLRPRRYVELGCGFSSLVSSRALRYSAEAGARCEVTYADPHPRIELAEQLNIGELLRKRVQELPIDLFMRLEPGDVLFVDTSHVLKLQSDVTRLLVTVLPALRSGVWIHFHDVFTPYDYPTEFVNHRWFSNNEQYAIEALLSGGDRYRVELPLYCLWKDHFDALSKFFPRGQRRPHGFWLRKQSGE